ncbi:ATP-binding protein [Nocardiopsis rhodophaea]|uniref:ATP-binding protein n=1 Tax=Nocardiopsis rhodophaea TaxID=280238 RepID=A0ABN2S5G4_9ACTN
MTFDDDMPPYDGPTDDQRDSRAGKFKREPSQAAKLVDLASQRYRLFMGTDARPYAVSLNGPNTALPLRGGRAGVRAALAKAYADAYRGQVPSQTALADALTVLEGQAADAPPEPVHLRIARHGAGVVVDLGTPDGACVLATPTGWEWRPVSPVLFRRTGLTSPLPDPERGKDGLVLLRELVNADESAFRLLVGWLVAALIPDIPHPVLAFKGEQGTGKSTAAKMAVNLVDPSPAPLRSMPRDVKSWAVTASASWVICLDNVSTIAPWLSDTLCKAVTGDGLVDRALYSDDDVTVLSFRRALAMTSIDTGTLAGDLSERLLTVELQPIPRERRRPDAEVIDAYDQARPVILGALLDLLCDVLAELPSLTLGELPRMADFARVLGALDKARGWSTLDTYTHASETVAADLLDGEPFGRAVVDYVEARGQWSGTVGDLLAAIPTPDPRPQRWPKGNPQAGSQLKRLAPVFRTLGIQFDDTQRSPDRRRARLYTLTAETAREPPSAPSGPSADQRDQGRPVDGGTAGAVRAPSHAVRATTGADSADGAPDSTPVPLSAPRTSVDQGEHQSSDGTDRPDSAAHPVSGDDQSQGLPTMPCPTCGERSSYAREHGHCFKCLRIRRVA